MGTTSNYSWPTPEATDLVKDGWDAIKDLGDAADTTVKAVSDAQGLVHIDTVTIGTTVSSVAVNDVFTSTYKNYKIIFNFDGASNTNDTALSFRLRAAGTSNSSALYQRRGLTAGASLALESGTNQAQMFIGNLRNGNTRMTFVDLELLKPQVNLYTNFLINSFVNNAGTLISYYSGGLHEVDASYDGFELLIGTGTLTGGTINIYGYRV